MPGKWTLKKTLEVSASHLLRLPYESKCCNLHGHNWKIEVHLSSSILDKSGMVMDFSNIKEIVMSLDHTDLTNIFAKKNQNSTAENIAKWIANMLSTRFPEEIRGSAKVDKVVVIETEGNEACYMP